MASLAILSTLLVGIPASPALAADCVPGAMIGNCSGGNPGGGTPDPNPNPNPRPPGGGGGGGGGSGGGGGGGGSHNPPGSFVIDTTRTHWDASRARAESCAATDAQGQGVLGVSIRTVTRYYFNGHRDAIIEGMTTLLSRSVTCHYPPAYRDTIQTCYLSSAVEIIKVAPNHSVLDRASRTTAWGSGSRTIQACAESRSVLALGANPTEFGRYKATARSVGQNATVRTWLGADPRTGVVPTPEIVRTSGTFNVVSPEARGQLTCAGWSNSWSGSWTWTAADCPGDGSGHTYQCVVGNDALIQHPEMAERGGWRGVKTQMKGDGQTFTIEWDQPRVQGRNLVSVDRERTRIQRRGEHWNPAQLSPTQQLVDIRIPRATRTSLVNENGTSWRDGHRRPVWEFNVYGAGNSWYQLETAFNLTVRTASVRIVGIDPATGAWVTEATTVHTPTSLACHSPEVEIEALRVVNF